MADVSFSVALQLMFLPFWGRGEGGDSPFTKPRVRQSSGLVNESRNLLVSNSLHPNTIITDMCHQTQFFYMGAGDPHPGLHVCDKHFPAGSPLLHSLLFVLPLSLPLSFLLSPSSVSFSLLFAVSHIFNSPSQPMAASPWG